MKTSTLFLFALMATLIYSGCSSKKDTGDVSNGKDTPVQGNSNIAKTVLLRTSRVAQYGEDEIDLYANPLDSAKGHRAMDTCHTNILFDSSYPLPRYFGPIDTDYFHELRDAAAQLDNGTNAKHVLGLKIIYGYDPGSKKAMLLYQPMYFQNLSKAGVKKDVDYMSMGRSTIFIFDSTKGFIPAPTLKPISNYAKHIKFKHPGDIYFSDFVDDSLYGSVKAVVYPFQELDSVVIANKSTEIYFCNAAERAIVKGKPVYKHVLLLGCSSVRFNPDLVGPDLYPAPLYFYSNFGNLAHLCPPNCDKLTFSIK